MIISTTPMLEGYEITEYLGPVFGEVVMGTDWARDIGASLRNIFGGRSAGYENTLLEARSEILNEITRRAQDQGADAIVGLQISTASLGADNTIMMLMCTGTAVHIRKR